MAKTKKELTKSNDKVVSGVFGGVAGRLDRRGFFLFLIFYSKK